jgi:hypothetical protein
MAHPPRPIQGLGTTLSVLLFAVVLADLLGIGVSAHRKTVFDRIVSGEGLSDAEAQASDTITLLVGVVQVGLWLAVMVLWLIWFFRARSNAELYGPVLRHARGWAIGAWFVPFLNLVRPKAITDDIARASDPAVPFTYRDITRLPKPPLITAWWTAFLLNYFAGRVLFSQYREAGDITDEPRLAIVEIVVQGVDAVAAVLALLVVRMITSRQEQKNRLLMQHLTWAGPVAPAGTFGP